MELEKNFERKKDKQVGLSENIVIIETPEARFRIIYGLHSVTQNPEDIENADCLILETGRSDYSTIESAEKVLNLCKRSIQYKRIVAKAAEEKLPIFFVDISGGDSLLSLQHTLRMVESAASYAFLIWLTEGFTNFLRKIFQKKITKREFLKLLYKTLLTIYFSLPTIAVLADIYYSSKKNDKESARRTVDRFLTKLEETTHPELNIFVLTFRNYLMAQKMTTIARILAKEKGEKPEVAIVVGAAHIGIETALQEDEKERAKFVEILSKVKGLEKVRERIATIARFDFDGERWKVTFLKDPALLSIETKK